jgi:hypothetical protein
MVWSLPRLRRRVRKLLAVVAGLRPVDLGLLLEGQRPLVEKLIHPQQAAAIDFASYLLASLGRVHLALRMARHLVSKR